MATVDISALGLDGLLDREWLAANQLGGYASSTAAGLNTRKYHGLLVAAMAPPRRRMVLLSRVEETVIAAGERCPLSCSEYPGAIYPRGFEQLRAFSTEPFPRWAYQADGWSVEKSIQLLRGENTVCISYTLVGSANPVELELRPLFALRGMHELTYQWNGRLDAVSRTSQHHRIPPTSRTPEVFFAHDGEFEANGCWYMSAIYRRESERGYAGLEDLWMPGWVRWKLCPGQTVFFVCSTEPIELDRVISELDRQTPQVVAPALARAAADPTLDALLRAADQYVVQLRGPQPEQPAAAHVVTQYPWSPPSPRDALIAFGGLFLVPRRFIEARSLLESFAAMERNGLLPSELPENGSPPRYAGADTALWFVNAVHEYLRYTGDDRGVRHALFDAVLRIVRCYQAGTDLGIGLDGDGLVASHAPGLGTSWMDAKVGDWVITPRQGRTVEVNALWYNALRIAAELSARFDRIVWAGEFTRLAESVRLAFNRRFWNELGGCCFDVLNGRGADPSLRPNQIFAISLPYPVLAPQRHAAVVQKIRQQLVTPLGVRTLACNDPSYQGQYRGDVVSRDRAYHQGSAYPWLLGPLARALVRLGGRSEASRADALNLLRGVLDYMQGDGLGQIGELFDGDEPHAPGGALASARSVGEVLRAYVEDVLNVFPQPQVSSAKATVVRPPVIRRDA